MDYFFFKTFETHWYWTGHAGMSYILKNNDIRSKNQKSWIYTTDSKLSGGGIIKIVTQNEI